MFKIGGISVILMALISTIAIVSAQEHHKPLHMETDFKRHVEHELNQLQPDSPEHPDDKDQGLYWFTLSDKDGNGKLDGYELMMALNDGLDAQTGMSLTDTLEHIDIVLTEDDLDGDGEISYSEFLVSEAEH